MTESAQKPPKQRDLSGPLHGVMSLTLHQSGDPPYDPEERGDRRVRPVASDSERARLAKVDDKGADEVNPDQHAHDRYEQVRPRHHQPAGHHPP